MKKEIVKYEAELFDHACRSFSRITFNTKEEAVGYVKSVIFDVLGKYIETADLTINEEETFFHAEHEDSSTVVGAEIKEVKV